MGTARIRPGSRPTLRCRVASAPSPSSRPRGRSVRSIVARRRIPRSPFPRGGPLPPSPTTLCSCSCSCSCGRPSIAPPRPHPHPYPPDPAPSQSRSQSRARRGHPTHTPTLTPTPSRRSAPAYLPVRPRLRGASISVATTTLERASIWGVHGLGAGLAPCATPQQRDTCTSPPSGSPSPPTLIPPSPSSPPPSRTRVRRMRLVLFNFRPSRASLRAAAARSSPPPSSSSYCTRARSVVAAAAAAARIVVFARMTGNAAPAPVRRSCSCSPSLGPSLGFSLRVWVRCDRVCVNGLRPSELGA